VKILLINCLYFPETLGGAERAVQCYAETLLQEGHDVVVYCLTGGQDTSEEIDGVKVLRVNPGPFFDNPYSPGRSVFRKLFRYFLSPFNLRVRKRLSETLEEEKPDIVHTNNLAGLSFSIIKTVRKRGIPIVHGLHDYFAICPLHTMFRKGTSCGNSCVACRIFSKFRRRRLKGSIDGLVGVSEHILEVHRRELGVMDMPSMVLHNPFVDIPNEPKRRNGKNVVFGYLGRIKENKGLEKLLESVGPLEDFELVIGGTGATRYVEKLTRLYQSDRVSFLGHVNVREYWSEIDVLIVPSLWNEPFGMVVVEAFSNGKPVVATRRGGIVEIVSHEVDGILYEPNRPNELLEGIEFFKKHPEHVARFAEMAFRKSKDFRRERVMRPLVSFYKRILE